MAEFGLAALIGEAAAKKLGLSAVIGVALAKFWKVILIAVALVAASSANCSAASRRGPDKNQRAGTVLWNRSGPSKEPSGLAGDEARFKIGFERLGATLGAVP